MATFLPFSLVVFSTCYSIAGHSDYDVFMFLYKITCIKTGIKNNSKTLCKVRISKFWAISCKLGFKVKVSKNLHMGNKTTQNFMLISKTLRKMREFDKKKVISSRPSWGPPLPHPQASVSPPFGSGGRHTRLRERGNQRWGTHSPTGKGVWGPNSDEETDTVVLFIIYLPWVLCLSVCDYVCMCVCHNLCRNALLFF
jgi:hypothetical protein